MQNEDEFYRIAPIFAEFLNSYEAAKAKNITPNEWLFDTLKSNLPDKTDEEINKFIADVEQISSDFDAVVKDAEECSKLYGWSAEIWAYRKILDKMHDDESDIDYWEYFDNVLKDISQRSISAIKKDAPDIMLKSNRVQSIDNKQEEVEEKGKETKKEKFGIDFETQIKKNTNLHFQKTMRLDASSLDARTSDMTDLANRLSKNVALAGMGEMAISASVAIATSAIKTRSLVSGAQLAKILIKSGTDSAIRNVLISSLKVGAEKNLLPFLGRIPSTVAITGVALITIQSVGIFRDFLKREIDVLTLVFKVSHLTTATILALQLSGVCSDGCAELAKYAEMSTPILNQICVGSATVIGGIVGNIAAIQLNKEAWKFLQLVKDNVKHFIERMEAIEYNMNFAYAPVFAPNTSKIFV